MNFKLFGWHVIVKRIVEKRPLWWTRKLRMKYARLVEKRVGDCEHRKLPRVVAIRAITLTLWGNNEYMNLVESKEWVEATFEDCGRGKLILL